MTFTPTMTPRQFVDLLLSRGLEVVVRNKQLRVWPWSALTKGMTAAEQKFFNIHYDELFALAVAGLPQTATKWNGRMPDPESATPAPTSTEPERCRGCGQSPCIGILHWAYPSLHESDPLVQAERHSRYFREFCESLRREHNQ